MPFKPCLIFKVLHKSALKGHMGTHSRTLKIQTKLKMLARSTIFVQIFSDNALLIIVMLAWKGSKRTYKLEVFLSVKNKKVL